MANLLNETLKRRYQGLPGIGVNGVNGIAGKKGNSIYIGYLRSFFDYERIKYPGYVYDRVKNMKNKNQSESEFYYRKDDNFYKKIKGKDDTPGQMFTFSVYNLRGLYFDKSAYGTEIKNTYKELVKSDDFYNRNKKNSDSSYVTIKGYDYFGLPEGATEEQIKEWKKRNINVDDINFPIRLSEEYLNNRDENDSNTNLSIIDSNDGIVVPTNLKSIFNAGDILYLQDDLTTNIISYIILTEDMLGCSFNKFLQFDFTSCESLESTFSNLNDRAILNKIFYIPEVNVPDKDSSDIKIIKRNLKFKENFVKRIGGDYLFCVPYNINKKNDKNEVPKKFIELKSSKSFEIHHQNKEDEYTKVEDNFVFRGSNFKMENLFIKNIDTNINVKEYNDENIKFNGKFHHLFSLDNNSLTVSEENDKVFIKTSSSKFFEGSSDSDRHYFYGIEVYKKNGNSYDFIKKFQKPIKENILEFVLDKDYFDNGETNLGFVSFVYGENTSTMYSQMSELIAYCDKSANKFRIGNYTFSQGTESKTEIDNDFDNNYCEFVFTDLTCDRTFDSQLHISSDFVITDVYFNNEHVIMNSEVQSQGYKGSWLKFNKSDAVFNTKKSVLDISNIFVDENIPDIELEGEIFKPSNIGECLYYFSQKEYRIGSKIQETVDRNIVVTAMTYDESTNTKHRSSFIITQPGFENPLKDVSVSFENVFLNNRIEESNKPENGILCNQFQYFVELNVHNFLSENWGKYFENPRIKIGVDLDTKSSLYTGNIEYSDDTNYNNVHIYSKYDKQKFKNNAFKTMFYWLKGGEGNDITNTMSDLNDNSHELKKSIFTGKISLGVNVDNDNNWVCLNDIISERNNNSTTIPYDFVFEIDKLNDDENCIGGNRGLTLNEVNNVSDKVKLRTICEIANPIPMEFNFRWTVNKIVIVGELKEVYKETWKKLNPDVSDTSLNGTIRFEKSYSEGEILSDNTKFIINPIYTLLCPEDKEDQTEIRGAVKKVGSEEGILIENGIMNIDSRSIDEFYREGYDDSYNRFLKSRFVDSKFMDSINISDITYYLPKNKYFQDNIKNISILSKNLRECVQSGLIRPKDSSFFDVLKILNSNKSFSNGRLNLYPIDFESDEINPDFSENYIQIGYNGNEMNPNLRNGNLTFYYNNEEYLHSRYNQWRKASPMWIKFKSVSSVSSEELIESKKIWNFEYEISDIFKSYNVFGGVLTKSGNGYTQLTEDFDNGQYEDDKSILSLKMTQEEGEKYILDTPSLSLIDEPDEEFINQPEQGKFFRSFVLNAEWNYPYFIEINNKIKVVPYIMVNPYESYLDSLVIDASILNFDSNFIDEYMKERCSEEFGIFTKDNGRDASSYIERKMEKNVWSVNDGGITSDSPVENVNSLNMFIPYNLLFDIYPRTSYNTDMKGNVSNILMLQQPSVNEIGNFKFNKRYFELNEQEDVRIISPWNFNI